MAVNDTDSSLPLQTAPRARCAGLQVCPSEQALSPAGQNGRTLGGASPARVRADSPSAEPRMHRLRWLLAVGLLAVGVRAEAQPGLRPCTWVRLNKVNNRLHGTVLDFTHNHGGDH